MSIRVMVKSHENGSNEEMYLCTDETEFGRPAEDFFCLKDGETIDIDATVYSLDDLQGLPLPFDRAMKAV